MRAPPRSPQPRGIALVFTVLFVVVLDCGAASGQGIISDGDPDAIATHVLNITLSGASRSWPDSVHGLQVLSKQVTDTVCGFFPPVVQCSAFLVPVDNGVLALQISVQTATQATTLNVHNILLQWSKQADNVLFNHLYIASAKVLGKSLDPLTYTSASYVMPCRGRQVYSLLPYCMEGQVPQTVAYITKSVGDVTAYLKGLLCGPSIGCDTLEINVAPPTATEEATIVTITNASLALEAILEYVADVRAAYMASHINLPTTGNPNAGVSAAKVELRVNDMSVALFSVNETVRYTEPLATTVSCPSSSGFWAFALISLVPLMLVLLRYMWYRGHKQSKKEERNAIIADERCLIEGYAGMPAVFPGAAETNTSAFDIAAPRLGREDHARTQQWVVDEQGNYYDMSSAQDPATDVGTSGLQPQPEEQQVSEEANALYTYADPNAMPMTDLYVDPTTGETYQYIDPETGEAYQYIDPETGEAYVYADPNAETS